MKSLRFLLVVFVMGAVCSVGSAALFFEDFESFTPGQVQHDLNAWHGWDAASGAASPVSDAHAYSGSNSIEIVPAADLVHIYDVSGGKWVFTAMQYIPSGTTGTSYFILLNTYSDGGSKDWSVQTTFNLATGAIGYWHGGASTLIYDEWIQLKYVIDLDENTVDKYYNGQFIVQDTWDDNTHGTLQCIDLFGNNASSVFYDDIKIQSYLSTLTAADNPAPVAQAVDVERDSVLEWTPGVYAAAHDVYFGTSAEDVAAADRANPADVLVSQGQTETSFDPAGLLEFGQTYYWRVDEVNSAPDNTVFKGDVWSFEVEPFSYPIGAITATASSAHSPDMQPEKTIDGSGLTGDLHNTEATHMWLSGTGDTDPWIQYTFDKVYKLHELWVWNSNQMIENFLGLGAKDVTISYSEDGETWNVLEDQTEFAQATSADDYAHNTTVDFGGIMAKYVKIAINSGYGLLPQYGLSEVRFYFIPTYARQPQPADGGTSQGANVLLDWRPGREAASHEVYLGTDPNALTLVGTTKDSSLASGPLQYATTYYWSVTEINEAEATPAYAGDLWSFTTPQYGIVDDFESYNDDCARIFFSWLDGYGHNGGEDIPNCNVAPFNGNGTGSIVGNDVSPFAEQSIVHSGAQSMPLSYDGMSETSLALGGQDWAANGVQTLSLAFRGESGNIGTLYVKINNTKISYNGSATDIGVAGWQTWNITLAGTGANLSNVTSLTIGVEGGGFGTLYIDDIRLYPQVFAAPASNIDIAISTQANWWTQAAADREMQKVVDNVSAPFIVFNASDQDGLADWVTAHTNNGVSNLLILCGQLPDTIYEPGNLQVDDSIVEQFLDAGNTIINTGDWIFYVVNGAGTNGAAGLQTIMDIPGVTVAGEDNTAVTVTAEGQAYTPSLQDFATDRPFHLDTLAGDWSTELVLAQNAAGTRADPVIVRNSATGGRIGIFYQAANEDNDPRGDVISEWINNWYLPTVSNGN